MSSTSPEPTGSTDSGATSALPSGEQWPIRAGGYEATVVEVSGGIRSLSFEGRPVLDGYAATDMCDGGRCQLLIPWPNRIDGGRYRFAGQDRQLAITEPAKNCAIHGLVRWVNWSLVAHDADRVTVRYRLHPQPGWPHVVELEVEHRLAADAGLTVTVTATNVGSSPAPYGNGAHPYLTAGTERIDDCRLEFPAATHLTADERGIPTGQESLDGTKLDFRSSRQLGDLVIDDAFTDLRRDADGRAWTTLESPDGRRSSLWLDESYRWLQIFSGDTLPRPERRRQGLGVEPMSCPPNAFVSGDGVIVLEPGQTTVGQWGIVAS